MFRIRRIFDDVIPVNQDAIRQVKDNIARLRFYERYGARPIIGTGYETPLSPEDTCIPHLLYDDLGTNNPLARSHAKNVVKAVLERKYKDLCSVEYVEQVVASIRDNPVKLRPFCHIQPHKTRRAVHDRFSEKIALVLNQDHDIHHIHERGYVESTVLPGDYCIDTFTPIHRNAYPAAQAVFTPTRGGTL